MEQTILVTGGASGFGRLTVETLARQGHHVFAGIRASTSRNAHATNELHALAEKEHLALQVVELDVTDTPSVTQAIEHIIHKASRLDVVVNNAGVSYSGPLEAFTLEQVQQQFETNVFGVIRVNRAALPHMRAQRSGLLLQIGSVVGRLAFPFVGLYGATKFAVEGLTESYRYELAALGIDAVVVEPGTYPTNLSANRFAPEDEQRIAPYAPVMSEFIPRFLSDILTTTPPNPQEVADAVATLIAQPSGTRPLRTLVALENQRQAPQGVNDATDRATQAYLEMLGVTDLLTLSPTPSNL